MVRSRLGNRPAPLAHVSHRQTGRELGQIAKQDNVRLHDLRHTCASMLLAQGVPPRVVMEILGHSSLDVTMNIYGHVMLDAQRDALRGMGGLFR